MMDDYRDRRTSVSSFKSNSSDSRRSSVDHTRRFSISRPDQLVNDETTESILIIGENQNSFVESKFCRAGSIQYRNAGWKSSRMRNDSSSSTHSNASGKQIQGTKEPLPQKVILQLTPEEQKIYIQQRFIEIAAILEASGVDEHILQKIRSAY